jgi:pre-mRNA-splicing factor ATP-dependent RNA helicase DHX38/PRP16
LFTKSPVQDYVESAVKQALNIHLYTEVNGDILIFMTGQEDIEVTCYILNDKVQKLGDDCSPLMICPIYSMLPS